MASDVTYQNQILATPPAETIVETEQQAGGQHRQVVKIAESALPSGAATATNQTDGSQRTGILAYRSSDGTYQPARLDKATNTLQIIDYEHHEIHAGSHFFVEDFADLAINNVYDVQFTTPNTAKWAHLTFELNCEAETEWYIYEGATIALAGTAITPINNNRNSATASTMTLAGITNTSVANANADTAVAGATVLADGIVGAGKSGGVIQRNREIVMKQNTIYCLRAVASAAGYTNFLMTWYEHENVA